MSVILFRYYGACVQANVSHVIYSNGTVQARCEETCTGEIMLSVGMTMLIGSTVWVVGKRLLRYVFENKQRMLM